MQVEIKKLMDHEKLPMDLLLLADPSRDAVEDYSRRGSSYIAKVKQQPVGVYVLLPTRPGIVELVNVAVAEEYHGKGIGKQLVMDAIQKATMLGYRTIEVGTGNSSIGQLALYQKCGFRIVNIDIDFFIRHYAEKIIENGIHCKDMIRLKQDL